MVYCMRPLANMHQLQLTAVSYNVLPLLITVNIVFQDGLLRKRSACRDGSPAIHNAVAQTRMARGHCLQKSLSLRRMASTSAFLNVLKSLQVLSPCYELVSQWLSCAA